MNPRQHREMTFSKEGRDGEGEHFEGFQLNVSPTKEGNSPMKTTFIHPTLSKKLHESRIPIN